MVVVYGIKLDLSIPMGAIDVVSTAKSRRKGLFDFIKDSIPVLNNETCRSYSTETSESGVSYRSLRLLSFMLVLRKVMFPIGNWYTLALLGMSFTGDTEFSV